MKVEDVKVGEYIQIGPDVRVYVQAVRSGQVVRLAIDAPESKSIGRTVVYPKPKPSGKVRGDKEPVTDNMKGQQNEDRGPD